MMRMLKRLFLGEGVLCVALLTAPIALLCGCVSVVTEPSTGLCWRSLDPDTGDQDVSLAIVEPFLTSTGTNEVRLSWEDVNPRILRWSMGRWSSTPALVRPGCEPMRYPVVVAAPSGNVVIAASANGKDGTAALHVARANDGSWEWLGAPLISSEEPFTHAHEASIAFLDGDHPVVAWSEERHVKLAGLLVARWDGSSWKRLGALNPEGDDYYLSPTVVVDANKQIWLSWRERSRGELRVTRWNGTAWLDVDRDALQRIATAQGSVARRTSFVVDGKGQAWVLWLASNREGDSSLALARWNGTTWMAVKKPRVPGGRDATVWSAAMILRGDVPLIAWSQSDETENHRLYVAEWGTDDRWSMRLSGLHLVEGVSDVDHIALAPGDERSFFVSWDEPGKDKRRTRVVHAYIGAPGETPTRPPRSEVERSTWPTTVDEAARRIVAELDDESKALVRAMKKDQLIQFHLGWGMGIRNSFGLWRGNVKLIESCGKGRRLHPDECSMIIIEAVWALLQDPSDLSSEPKPLNR